MKLLSMRPASLATSLPPCAAADFVEEPAALDTSALEVIEKLGAFGMARVTELRVPVIVPQRFCDMCQSVEDFIAPLDSNFGLVGCCSTCRTLGIAPFTRAVSGVA